MEKLSIKLLKTALLASAFALATTVAFAQVGVGASGSAGTGANVGGTNGSTQLNSGANVNAGGNKAGVDANASDSTSLKKNRMQNQTTGSGSSGDIKANGAIGDTNRVGR
jgi:hypothetical protein